MIGFNGYFTSMRQKPVTYMQNGIRKHKPPFGSVWDKHSEAKLVTGVFTNAETGEITDEFYGNCNDFNLWFLGKVGRGERFDVYIKFTGFDSFVQVDQVGAWLGASDDPKGYRQQFEHDDKSRWTMIAD